MSSKSSNLSEHEKNIARNSVMLNAKLVNGELVLNYPGGETYWAVRNKYGHEYLSPEAAVAQYRGVNLEYGYARGHTIPWTSATPDDLLQVAGADSRTDNVRLARALEDVAEWLGYECTLAYVEDCRVDPATVADLLKNAQ